MSFSLVPCLLLAAAAPALCQQTAARTEQQPVVRRYVSGGAGATFGTDKVPTFSGEYGERVGKNVFAFANYAYYDDLMTDQMRATLGDVGDLLTSITGSSYSFTGRDRGLAFTLGAKAFLTGGSVRPYVGGGVGGLNLHRAVTEASTGDVTQYFSTTAGVGDGNVPPGASSSTKPLGEVLFGVNFFAGRTYVDVGYRYRRAFHAESLDFSQVTASVGVTF